jgi:hypothetical protein
MSSDNINETNNNADFVTIVSSEMIANVMEEHFNKVMYKKKVTIVDLKPTDSGYMFSLAFVEGKKEVKESKNVEILVKQAYQEPMSQGNGYIRGKNGKFIGKKKVEV